MKKQAFISSVLLVGAIGILGFGSSALACCGLGSEPGAEIPAGAHRAGAAVLGQLSYTLHPGAAGTPADPTATVSFEGQCKGGAVQVSIPPTDVSGITVVSSFAGVTGAQIAAAIEGFYVSGTPSFAACFPPNADLQGFEVATVTTTITQSDYAWLGNAIILGITD